MQSEAVCSLNHETTTPFALTHTPTFQKFTPTCTSITVWGCTHMAIHSMSRSKTLCICMIWMWDATWDLLQRQPWIRNVIQARPYNNFQIFTLNLDVCNRLSVQSYTYSQHNNVLKHYIYIWYGNDKQSAMVYSLKHETRIPFVILILPIFIILSATPLWCISVTPYPVAYSMLFNVLIHLYMHERWMIIVGFVRSGQWQCASITHAAVDQPQTFLTTSLLTYCT